jgi:hypothetical protein
MLHLSGSSEISDLCINMESYFLTSMNGHEDGTKLPPYHNFSSGVANKHSPTLSSPNLYLDDIKNDLLEPIAIIGMSLRFPQDATSPASFWKMMEEKRCAMTEWPSDRLNIDAFYHPDKNKNCNVISFPQYLLFPTTNMSSCMHAEEIL